MSIFTPRTSTPEASNKNYMHTSAGGYNKCIEIANGSVLPNCVGYAYGRWREILGFDHKLSTANAENWFGNTSDGYERGQTPKIGAVICWRKGQAGNSSDGAGHIGIVEDVNADGSIVVSNSAYGGTRFYMKTLSAPYNIGSAYTFQGFIYLPVNFSDTGEMLENDNSTNDKNDLGLEWWGDIIKVVLCILLIIVAVVLLGLGVKGTLIDTITGG